MSLRLLLAIHLALSFSFVGLLYAEEPAKSGEIPAAKAGEAVKASEAVKKEGDKKQPKTRSGDRFMRVRRDEKGRPVAMETAVTSYVAADGSKPGVAVDLVGAVHVGDRNYYDELNKLFESYDVVLYELVAPQGTVITKEARTKGGSAHPIGMLQEGMKSMLALEHQLDCVDYTKKNFMHADMSPEEFSKSMTDRGESFMQMFLRMMGQGMAQQNASEGTSEAALLMAFFSRDRAFKLKVAMAEQLEVAEGQLDVLGGPEGSTIITERNRKAFEVLGKELEAGKKKIAVFYGAGHLPDMQERLQKDFGMKRAGEKWLTAWSLEKSAVKKEAVKKEEKKK